MSAHTKSKARLAARSSSWVNILNVYEKKFMLSCDVDVGPEARTAWDVRKEGNAGADPSRVPGAL